MMINVTSMNLVGRRSDFDFAEIFKLFVHPLHYVVFVYVGHINLFGFCHSRFRFFFDLSLGTFLKI